jgi:rhomboid protease GluP
MKAVTWNSPVILSFALLSGAALALNSLTGGWANAHLFSVYRGSLTDPLFYVRLFLHVLGHASLSHYASNMILFLLVGPLLEEKYGSRRLLSIIAIVALVTGLVHILLPGNTALLGASGVDFAFILLASVTGTGEGIPLTLIIVAVIYIGQQIIGLSANDNISQLTHIIGGSIGAVYGMAVKPRRR